MWWLQNPPAKLAPEWDNELRSFISDAASFQEVWWDIYMCIFNKKELLVWWNISGHFLAPRSGKVRVNWSPAVLRRPPTHIFSTQLQDTIYFCFYLWVQVSLARSVGPVVSDGLRHVCVDLTHVTLADEDVYQLNTNWYYIWPNMLPGGRPAWPRPKYMTQYMTKYMTKYFTKYFT